MFEFLKKLVKKTPEKKSLGKKIQVKKTLPKKIKAKVAAPTAKVAAPNTTEKKSTALSFAEKIKAGLSKTREKLNSQLSDLFHTGKIDENFYEELQMTLLSADVGISASEFLIEKLRQLVKEDDMSDPKRLKDLLKLQI